MSTLDAYYPRVETISVPDDIKPEYIGLYVSDYVVRFLTDLGQANINRKSIRVGPLGGTGYLWALMFDTSVGYALPKDLDIRRPHNSKRKTME